MAVHPGSSTLRRLLPWGGQAGRGAKAGPDAVIAEAWVPEFGELVERHQSMVFSLAWRMTGDRGLAEEVAQDVLLELDRKLAQIQSDEHARRWLRQAATQRSIDACRRRRRQQPGWDCGLWMELDELDELGESHAATGLKPSGAGAGLSVRLEAMMARLPEAQRAVIVLRYQEEMMPEEIAAALKAPVATVKSYLQRALKRLRAEAASELKEYIREA